MNRHLPPEPFLFKVVPHAGEKGCFLRFIKQTPRKVKRLSQGTQYAHVISSGGAKRGPLPDSHLPMRLFDAHGRFV
jgi:hypothetical protein